MDKVKRTGTEPGAAAPTVALSFYQGYTRYDWVAAPPLPTESSSPSVSSGSNVLTPDSILVASKEKAHKGDDITQQQNMVLTIHKADSFRKKVSQFGMPKGFPHTVAPGYQSFFYYSIIGASISNFSSSIGYQTLLSGFFLDSSPQFWMLKDLFPAMLATYLANRVVSYENRPKFWYMISVLLYNGTVIADMFIPSLPANQMVFAAVCTSVLKQSSALMFVVTRACALQHYAVDNNLGEVTKKFNSFSMVIYTVATAAGIGFCYLVPSFTVQMSIAVGCVFLNQLVIAPLALRPLHFRILNFSSMCALLLSYTNGKNTAVLTPSEVSALLGLREKPVTQRQVSQLVWISPPLKKLVIHGSRIRQDVLFVNSHRTYLLGLFETTSRPLSAKEYWKRRELPEVPLVGRLSTHWRRMWQRKRTTGDRQAAQEQEELQAKLEARLTALGGRRLVLLVQTECSAADIIEAYFLMFTALLKHGETTETLKAFLQECQENEDKWKEEAAVFCEQLAEANWDIVLPLLDHPDYRLTSLLV